MHVHDGFPSQPPNPLERSMAVIEGVYDMKLWNFTSAYLGKLLATPASFAKGCHRCAGSTLLKKNGMPWLCLRLGRGGPIIEVP